MARCGCGGACSCALTAGNNITLTGTGAVSAPWTVNAVTNVSEVRAALTSGSGTVYDPTDGSFDVCVSANAGNGLTKDAGGCLYVGTGAATVTSGAGLLGNGAPATPVRANVSTWPYVCPVATAGSGIYVDGTGLLKGGPSTKTTRYSVLQTFTFSPVLVPTTNTALGSVSVAVTNPDGCTKALCIIYKEMQVNYTIPAGSTSSIGVAIDGDGMFRIGNTGTATLTAQFQQVSKMVDTILDEGETRTLTFAATATGVNSPTIDTAQLTMRAWIITNSV